VSSTFLLNRIVDRRRQLRVGLGRAFSLGTCSASKARGNRRGALDDGHPEEADPMQRIRALGLAALLAVPAVGFAQDPVPLYPENYKVLLEDDRVRVLDFTLRKGASEKAHFHPPNVAVFLADFKIRFTLPDGSTRMREGHPGEVAWSDAIVHAPVNVGETDAHGILVELKTAAAVNAARK
jgi:quercetin dioxygenase-like cupin family protein